MTVRTFHARLMSAYALQIQEQQAASRAIALGVGRLFSEEGSKEMDAALEDALAAIRGQAGAIMGGKPIDAETLTQAGKEAVARSRQPKVLTEEEMVENTQKVVQKLDAAMSMLTGKMHRNPAFEGMPPQPGDVTPFDLRNSSVADVMKRVNGGNS